MASSRLDAVIPIVFPEFKIKVSEPVRLRINLDPVELFDIRIFDGFKYDGPEVFDGKIEDLGHAGVLFFRGRSPGTRGLTKYYEYGRYDAAEMGITRRVPIPDVTLGPDARPTKESLTKVLSAIAHTAGHGTRIQATYIERPGTFESVLRYADGRMTANKNPKREAYSIWTNSCLHFMIGAAEAAGVSLPWLADPSPASYADEMQNSFPDLDFDPKSKVVTVEAGGNTPAWAVR